MEHRRRLHSEIEQTFARGNGTAVGYVVREKEVGQMPDQAEHAPRGAALITGGSGGIGAAIARRLGSEGYDLALVARDGERLKSTVAALHEAGYSGALALTCDITDPDAVQEMIEDVIDRFGRIDVLVNTAGISRAGFFLRTRLDEWNEILRVNLTGVMLTTQAVLRPMRRQRSGTIVTIASLGGRQGRETLSTYCASKFGVVGLMDTVRREVDRLGIRVTTILPGEGDRTMHQDGPERGERRRQPEDVAEAVSFALALGP